MALTVHTLTIDCLDPSLVASFWCAMLDYRVEENDTDSIHTVDPARRGPALLFTPAGRQKTDKNRLHFDLRPDDRDSEVARALRLGATPVDIGQSGTESWIVLADPEGNEFCILQSERDLRAWRAQRQGSS